MSNPRRGRSRPAIVLSFTLSGIEAVPVEVQVSADAGYPVPTIVGLPDKAVRESLDRIYAAFHTAGLGSPDKRVTINLAPAEIRKEGSALDLPIALGILAALGKISTDRVARFSVAGELALDGRIRPIRGALAMALAVARRGGGDLLLPAENHAETQGVPGVRVGLLRDLVRTIRLLTAGGDGVFDRGEVGHDRDVAAGPGVPPGSAASPPASLDMAEVQGQAAAKRALEVAAAGGHNLLMSGPPGAGKTLLAQRLPGILPRLSEEEALEATVVHSVAGLLPVGVDRLRTRPFRAPHHTVTGPGLVGGGAVPRPGEVSLAHCGVLFLDEMTEFRPQVLNLLRQPLEEGVVHLVRAGRTVRFPCRFMLVGAMNPCPCGFLGHRRKPCKCSPRQVQVYKNRISGPLMDRLDLHIEVPVVKVRELMVRLKRRGRASPASTGDAQVAPGGSTAIRQRVEAAREIQRRRFAGIPGLHCNAQMGIPLIEAHCRIEAPTRALLQQVTESLSLSARAVHRTLRVARTIADLADAKEVDREHVAEAVQYRPVEELGRVG